MLSNLFTYRPRIVCHGFKSRTEKRGQPYEIPAFSTLYGKAPWVWHKFSISMSAPFSSVTINCPFGLTLDQAKGSSCIRGSMPNLPRAARLAELARQEFAKRQKAIEVDNTISKITLEFIIGSRSGDPVKIRYLTSSESDLTNERS